MEPCPNCYGSGGGDEPPLECLVCNGTGDVPDYSESEPPEEYECYDDCPPLWSPY